MNTLSLNAHYSDRQAAEGSGPPQIDRKNAQKDMLLAREVLWMWGGWVLTSSVANKVSISPQAIVVSSTFLEEGRLSSPLPQNAAVAICCLIRPWKGFAGPRS